MKRTKDFTAALLIVAATLLVVELGLRWLDPWGMVYFDDATRIGRAMLVNDPDAGFSMVDGVYVDAHSTATVVDGRRVTPDTGPAACSLAMLGDSVTFGAGVNDDETFVDLLARDLPGVEVVNYGVPRYNSENVRRAQQAYPEHDVYLYTIFANDGEPAYHPALEVLVAGHEYQPYTIMYMKFVLRRTQPPGPIDTARVRRDMDALAEAGVHFVAFAGEPLTDMLQGTGYDLHIVPFPEHPISAADFHLNPQGHAELAADLLPVVRDITTQAC